MASKNQSFDDYLQDRHAAQYCGLDDEMGEDYEEWLEQLDVADIISWAEMYGASQFSAGMEYGIKPNAGIDNGGRLVMLKNGKPLT